MKFIRSILQEFERIVIRCIIYYNCSRVIENYPYSLEMLSDAVSLYAYTIWNWKKENAEANLIDVSKKDLILTLLPRTSGKFTRRGLKANGLRYFADGYKEQFLQGGDVIISYDPENCSKVWIKEKDGSFVEFTLIENTFQICHWKKFKTSNANKNNLFKMLLKINIKQHGKDQFLF